MATKKRPARKASRAKKIPPHPMQPFVMDKKRVVRFRENAIVRYLVDEARKGRAHDMNSIVAIDFPQEDLEQFCQLIGYSLGGYHELSFVSDASAHAASKASGGFKGCRDTGCAIHIGVPKEKPRPNWKPSESRR